ncbi:uncharacterized protein LOC126984421 [Eriocheir sinensis]|uniref:uncharacterized protein LOC126984421 n=1 Tax=Eriocheir sinensis TaxID=95602 RepID=UPI0021C598A1|nr:uncharacterized protein LOC126984421 [Eriocheir sinensis]
MKGRKGGKENVDLKMILITGGEMEVGGGDERGGGGKRRPDHPSSSSSPCLEMRRKRRKTSDSSWTTNSANHSRTIRAKEEEEEEVEEEEEEEEEEASEREEEEEEGGKSIQLLPRRPGPVIRGGEGMEGGEGESRVHPKSFERRARVQVIRASGGVKVLINTGVGTRRRRRALGRGGGGGGGDDGGDEGEAGNPVKRIAVSTLNYFGGGDEVERTPNNNNKSNVRVMVPLEDEEEEEVEGEVTLASTATTTTVKEREKRKRRIETSDERSRRLRKLRRKRDSHHHHRHHHSHHHGRGHMENRLPPHTSLATRPRETPLRQLPRACEANTRTQDPWKCRKDTLGLSEDANENYHIEKNCETPSAPSGGKSEALSKGKRDHRSGRSEEPSGPYTFDDMVAEAKRKRESLTGGRTDEGDEGNNNIDHKVKCDSADRKLQGEKEVSKNDSHTCPTRRPLPPLPALYPLHPNSKGGGEREGKGGKNRRLGDKGKCSVRRRENTVVKHAKVTPRESDLPGESVKVKVEPKEGDCEKQTTTDDLPQPVIFSGDGGGVAVVAARGSIPGTPLTTTPLATSATAAQIAPPYTIRLSLAGLQHVKPTIVIISTGKGKHRQVLLISAGIASPAIVISGAASGKRPPA